MPRAAHVSLVPLILALVPLAAEVGCGKAEEPVRTEIIASFSAPRGVLDRARQLELRVLEGQVTCDTATGTITDDGAREIAKSNLDDDNCPSNVKFCGTVSIEKSPSPRVFEAKARGGADVVAVGCATVTVDQDAVPVSIKMYRFLAPAVCGDGVVQPTEQCEPGGTDLCDESCQSNEVRLSVGVAGNKTSTGKAGDKTDAFFLWPQGTGNGGRFLALYTDRAISGGNVDVGLRVMRDDLSPATTPPALANGSILLPNGSAFPPDAAPGRQSLPQAAFFGGKYWVVFQDDNSPGASGLDIHARSINNVFSSDQPAGAPLFINGDEQGEPQIQTAPAIAPSTERLLVAWEDQGAGRIVARTLTPPSTLGNQNDLSTGNGNSRPQIASRGKDWVVVWNSGAGIKRRTVGADGTPSGSEEAVNTSGAGANGARVASLPDGRFAVAWSKDGNIFVQRFDARAIPIADDQVEPINDVTTEGEQTQPTIAATPAAGGSYVVAWHDASSGHIRARFLGGSAGFLFNNVNGQSTEFQASRVEGHDRAAPVVAVGGSGPYVAIGWEDKSPDGAGIVVRRFPLPSE